MSVQTTTDAPISDESLTRKASHPRGMHVLNVGRSSRDHRPTRVYVRASGNAPGVCYMYSRVTGARTTKSMLIIIKMDEKKQIHLQCTRYSRLLALTRAMIRRNCLYWTYDRSSITDLCKLVITSAPLVCIAGSRQRISNETLKIHGVCYVWFDCRIPKMGF